jgi:hypothetical protein
MPQTQVLGKSGNPLEVDPQYLAARIALRPLDYTGQGKVLGHYSVGQRSGEIAATLGANAHLARIRWAPPDGTSFLVLMRLKLGLDFGRRDVGGDRAGLQGDDRPRLQDRLHGQHHVDRHVAGEDEHDARQHGPVADGCQRPGRLHDRRRHGPGLHGRRRGRSR